MHFQGLLYEKSGMDYHDVYRKSIINMYFLGQFAGNFRQIKVSEPETERSGVEV